MKKTNQIGLIVNIISFGLLISVWVWLIHFKNNINFYTVVPDGISLAIGSSIVFIFLSNLFVWINSIFQFRSFNEASFLFSSIFVFGVFSLILFFVDVVMLSEIGKEYLTNHNISNEWRILFINLTIHAIFIVLSSIYCWRSIRKEFDSTSSQEPIMDEAVFLTANQVGLLSSLVGISSMIWLARMGLTKNYLGSLSLIFYLTLLVPYALSVVYWFLNKRKTNFSDWYDEKQFLDISRSGLITLITITFITIGIFALIALNLINLEMIILLPNLLFLILGFFSGGTLILQKSEN